MVGQEEDLSPQAIFLVYESTKKLDRSRLALNWRPQLLQLMSRRILRPGPLLLSARSTKARSLSVRSLKMAVPRASTRLRGISPTAFRQRAINAFFPCEAFSRTRDAIFSSSLPMG